MNRLTCFVAGICTALPMALLPSVAWATTVGAVPEPESWALAALAAVAAAIVTIRNRRK